MAYVSEGYYRKDFGGKHCGEDLEGLILQACGIVDGLTHNRIREAGIGGLTGFQRRAVRRAVCLIVDGLAAGGGVADVEAFWMQDMRINMRRRKMKPWEVAGISFWAWTTLMQTGLMKGSF